MAASILAVIRSVDLTSVASERIRSKTRVSVVKCRQAIVGDFQYKSVVDDAVGAFQPSVNVDVAAVDVRHALQERVVSPN